MSQFTNDSNFNFVRIYVSLTELSKVVLRLPAITIYCDTNNLSPEQPIYEMSPTTTQLFTVVMSQALLSTDAKLGEAQELLSPEEGFSSLFINIM